MVVAPRRANRGVKVPLDELETLYACLNGCGESQRRMCESMTFFARQVEDEKKITEEANTAVMTLIIRGNMEANIAQ